MSFMDNDLRPIAAAAAPLIDQWLDLTEQFAAIRDACTEKGLDWSQLKAVLKAQAQDARDGGERMEKLLGKADNAAAYVRALKNNNFSSSHDDEPLPPTCPPVYAVFTALVSPAQVCSPAPDDGLDLPPELDRHPDRVLPAASAHER